MSEFCQIKRGLATRRRLATGPTELQTETQSFANALVRIFSALVDGYVGFGAGRLMIVGVSVHGAQGIFESFDEKVFAPHN